MLEENSNAVGLGLGLGKGCNILHQVNCFGCGPKNPYSMHLDLPFDETIGEISTSYSINKNYAGAPEYVHGGILAVIADELQGVLCNHLGYLVMTDSLKVKYHKAVSLEVEYQLHAKLNAVRKSRLYTSAYICDSQGQRLVESSATWYIMPLRLLFKISPQLEAQKKEIQNLLEANRKRARNIRWRLRQKTGLN